MTKPTDKPFWQAASPKPSAMCVLSASVRAIYGRNRLLSGGFHQGAFPIGFVIGNLVR